jgi:hypothetical protein
MSALNPNHRVAELTTQDVTDLSPKFWATYTDNITAVDGAAISLLSIQYDLVAGTLAPWAAKRPEVATILQKLLDFHVSCVVLPLPLDSKLIERSGGQFLLTEQAHGYVCFAHSLIAIPQFHQARRSWH